MSDTYRTLVAALDRLTEQARRIADQGEPRVEIAEQQGYRPTGTTPEPTTAPGTAPPIAEQPEPDVLRVLLDRVQRGVALTPDEARLLREHVEQLHHERDRWQRTAEYTKRDHDRAANTLDEVLRHFVHKGHPGEPCLQTGWIAEKTVAKWRSVLAPADTTKE